MSLISRLFAKKEPHEVRSFFSGGTSTMSKQQVTPDSSIQVAAVFACCKVLSESIASLPLHIYKRNGKNKERDTNHQLYSLLHDSPNSWQTSFDFRILMMLNLCLHGNFYARKLLNGAGRVGELIPLNPTKVKPEWNESKTEIIYKVNTDTGVIQKLRAEDIFHIKGFSLDGITGLSPIAAAKESIGLSMASEKHAAALFGNGARPGGILYFANPISIEAQDRFLSDWNAKFNSSGFGKVALLQNSEVKYESVGMSMEDAQFIQVRQFQISEIARIFRVPAHMVGDLSKSSFSNIEQQSLEFVVHTLRPWIVNIEQSIHKSLLSESEKKVNFVEFSVDGLLRGDIAGRYAAYNTAIQAGFMSRDEVRELENRNPIPNGDGEIFLQPLNMTQVGTVQEESEPEPEETEDEERALNFDSVKINLKNLAIEQLSRAIKKDSDQVRKAISSDSLESFAETLKEKKSEFLYKLLRGIGKTYTDLYFPDLEGKADSLIREYCERYYSALSQALIEQPNAGLIADECESEKCIELAATKFFEHLTNEAKSC